jgi:SAM-dependent methyltransferase
MRSPETAEELRLQGHRRLHPRLTDPNYLILRKRRQLFQCWLEGVTGGRLSVLDVGGRLQPYRPLIAERAIRYLAIDLAPTPLVNAVARAEHLPFASECFDVVFCTQVLEYIPDPGAAVGEIYRVLKPGGFLFLSVPTIFPRDSEQDCWRFEPAALRSLLSVFARVKIEPEGGSVAGFFRTANVFLLVCVKFMILREILSHTVTPLINMLGLSLDSLASDNDQFAANYSVLAQKP